MRKRIDFWLDDTRPSDVKLWKTIQKLRAKRSFAQIVKDGILIVSQLRQGKLDALLRLHPWVVDKILQTYAPQNGTSGNSGDMEKIAELAAQKAAQQVALSMPSLPSTEIVAAPLKESGKGIGSKTIALPVFDEDDSGDTIVLTKATNASANGGNLLGGMLGL